MVWNDYDDDLPGSRVGTKEYKLGPGKVYHVNRYERWENDETQVSFAIPMAKGRITVHAEDPAYDAAEGPADRYPTLLEVKAALALHHVYELTPREAIELEIAKLERTLRWQTHSVSSTTKLVEIREAGVVTAVEDAKRQLAHAQRQLVLAEATAVATEASLTALRAQLAALPT